MSKSHVTQHALAYRGLGPLPDLPVAPRPPLAGHVWTWDGGRLVEVRLVRARLSINAARAADTVLSEDVQEAA